MYGNATVQREDVPALGDSPHSRRRAVVQDVVVAVIPMALATYQGLALPVGELGAHGRDAYVLVGVLTALPLLLRRVAPLLSLVLVTGVSVVGPLMQVMISNSMLTALALACYSYGCYGRLSARLGWGISLLYPVGWILSVPAQARGAFLLDWGPVILVVDAWLALAAYAGHVQRQRLQVGAEVCAETARVQARAQALAALDVAHERHRIAADLQLVVRRAVDDLRRRTAEAAAALNSGGRGASAALDAVAESGRHALMEMRRLLGVLREGTDVRGEEPPDDVHRWQEDAAAVHVDLSLEVPPDLDELPAPAVAAARRTVEVATHLARDGGRRAGVTVRVADGELLVRATVAAVAQDEPPELEALRERLRLTGGRLSVDGGDGTTVLDVAVPVQRIRVGIPVQTPRPRSQATPRTPAPVPHDGSAGPSRRDVGIAAVVAALGVAEVVLRPDYGHVEAPRAVLPGVLVMLVFAALLLVRERWTWPGLAAVVVLTAVVGFDVVRFSGALHVVIAMYLFLIAGRSSLRTSLLALGAIAVAHLPVLARMDWSCLCVVVVLGIAGSATAIGRVAQRRDELNRLLARRLRELEADRERQAELAVAEERRRVAREMHDVVAHALSVAVLQAGAAAGVVEHDSAQAAELLRSVRSAVDSLALELATLVQDADVLDDFDLDALVEQERRLGRQVTLVAEGSAPRSAGVRLVAFRIVQEALTNARKHAPQADVLVTVRGEDSGLEVEVTSGPAASAEERLAATGSGLGLRGMQERAAVVGGRVDTSATHDGGFRVSAWLPEAVRV